MDRPWLAIETATDLASVAVGIPPLAQGAAFVQGARQHAAQIVSLVDRVLAPAGVRPEDLEGIVLGDGPGSFTGLRIGWAAAKGLAQESGLSLRAVPSLMVAAAGAARVLGAVPVAACFDALRGQVYGAVYVIDAHAVETLVPPLVLTIDELAGRSPQRPRLVVGDGALRYADQVARWSGAAPVPLEALGPPAVSPPRSSIPPPASRCTAAPPRPRRSGRRATAAPYQIRPVAAPDLPAIHAIEEVAFSDPWSVKDFRECLATGVPFLVAVAAGNDVVGYAIAHAAADEGEILNLGVAAVHRRQGVGRRLVLATMEALAARGARTVYLEVRESNAAARGLYQQLGFGEVGRRSRYYRQPVEDAILLRAAISAETGDA